MLVGVLGVHLVAQHFLAPGGLRDYANVVDYLRQPLAAVIEVMLLGSVIVHACLGIRASLVDVLGEAALRRVSLGLACAGVVAIVYGVWLIAALLTAPA
jgi:succinate dehydrogenase hydrophobic anchor subunit